MTGPETSSAAGALENRVISLCFLLVVCGADDIRTESQRAAIVAAFRAENGSEWKVEPLWQGVPQVARARRTVAGTMPSKKVPAAVAAEVINKNRHFLGLEAGVAMPAGKTEHRKDQSALVSWELTPAWVAAGQRQSHRRQFFIHVTVGIDGRVCAIECNLAEDDAAK